VHNQNGALKCRREGYRFCVVSCCCIAAGCLFAATAQGRVKIASGATLLLLLLSMIPPRILLQRRQHGCCVDEGLATSWTAALLVI